MSGLVHSLLEQARRRPDTLAVADTQRVLTYKRLVTLATVMRDLVLRETQVPRVGIVLPSSAAMAATIYGTLWAGRTAIPINFMLQPRELEEVIRDSGIDLIITIRHFASMLEKLPARKLFLEDAGLKHRLIFALLKPRPRPPETDPHDTAVILYTSGTSGVPKGVCLTHDNLLSNTRACVEHAQLKTDHLFLGMIPQFHGYGLTALLFAPITIGSTVYYLPRFNPTQAVETIRQRRISVLVAIPSMLSAILRLKSVDRTALSSLQLVVSGGEPLPATVFEGWRDRFGIELLEGYGMTETSPVMSINVPGANKPGSVGRAIPGIEFRIVDENDRALGTNQEGEIQVRGPHVMPGYYNKPDETRAAFREDGWFCTGDVGKIDEDGFAWITGRKKEMIIVGGENVFPREVERALEQHPAVAEAAVIGRKDASRGEVVVAYVILREGAEATEIALRNHCRDHLAGYKIPRDVFIVADLPRGPTGKVLKRQLREQLQQSDQTAPA